ncbi:MAG: zinc ribbon domain-containing protein [Methanomassiliicoccus sp.]|nr:zinc ribbon domain-containing protein [Methanomassiliicoccus sp.]
MFDPKRPLSARFNVSGLGERVRKIISARKGDGGGDARPKERPRIQITGREEERAVCQVCMGRIKPGTEYSFCGAGKFHSSCIDRVGHCPFCRRNHAIMGNEEVTSRRYVPINVPSHPEREERQTIAGPMCPACGEPVGAEANICLACGAIFVAESGTFPCPSCGSTVDADHDHCDRCGEPFQPMRSRSCPACGRAVEADVVSCICGAVLGDQCPKCGSMLPEDATVCGACGSLFEFV